MISILIPPRPLYLFHAWVHRGGLAALLPALATIPVGSPAPDFSASDASGHPHSLRELLRWSRFLILAFLGGPSPDNAPVAGYLMEIGRRFRAQGLRIAVLT